MVDIIINGTFSSELLLTYLDSCKNAGIKFVELGFKSFSKDGFWGPFYYTTDDYLEQFDLPSDITYAVMQMYLIYLQVT